MNRTHVVIVGAGPYGLSLAAHLSAHKVPYRIFGEAMAFWSKVADAAPERYLKSFALGTDISAPFTGAGFSQWCAERGYESFEPCAMKHFAAYGLWFQQNYVANLEPWLVETIQPGDDGFEVHLRHGETLRCNNVVLATGLSYAADIPDILTALPGELVKHSNEIEQFSKFRGLAVAVIGAGQSALEAAALVHEAGGHPTLVIRDPSIKWMTRLPARRGLLQRMRHPISGLGAGPKAWLLTNFPGACHRLPQRRRVAFVRSHLPPEGAWWLRARVDGVVPSLLNTKLSRARLDGHQVALGFVNGSKLETERRFDRVIAATGYRIDVDRLDLIDTEMKRKLARIDGSPRLDSNFRSNIEGLYFIGPSATLSFGPLFRFVVGAKFAAARLSAHLQKSA